MDTFSLKTESRTEFGGREAAALRGTGRYPATLVGEAKPTVQFSVSADEFDAAVRSTARSFELGLEAGSEKVAIQDVQWDRMGDKILQIDFIRDSSGDLAIARAVKFGDKGFVEEEDEE
jgi:ribosomal protein L25 (general stress protein Ctc)